MNKIIISLIVFLINTLPIKVYAQDVTTIQIPSDELQNLIRSAPDHFNKLSTSAEDRVNFFIGAWGRATRASHVDNRAYLFALAIDLYNTLPPDIQPDLKDAPPEEDSREVDYYPYKQQMYSEMRALHAESPNRLKEMNSAWEYNMTKLPPAWKTAAVEIDYITYYLHEQISQNVIVLDAYKESPSLDSAQLDITNPTHYKLIREHMEKMQPAIDAGIPPWEAERYFATQGSAQTQPNTNTTTTAIQTTDATQPATEQSSPLKQTILNNLSRWEWQALIVGLALVAVGKYLSKYLGSV